MSDSISLAPPTHGRLPGVIRAMASKAAARGEDRFMSPIVEKTRQNMGRDFESVIDAVEREPVVTPSGDRYELWWDGDTFAIRRIYD